MDYQTRKVGKTIATAKEDLKMSVSRLEGIDHNSCDERTMHLIDEAVDCISMAQRFLNQIDLSKYGADFNGEDIVMKKMKSSNNNNKVNVC